MAYSTGLADKIREYLAEIPAISIEEKKMFRGLTFMVNGKMCINVSGENLMCRFDPVLQEELSGKKGYQPMLMKGRELKGYCYVSEEGYRSRRDFEYWCRLCLEFNHKAESSKKKPVARRK